MRMLVTFRQIIEKFLSATSALEWNARVLVRMQSQDQGRRADERDVVVVRRLLRRAPLWKKGHQILRDIAVRQGDADLVKLCDQALMHLR